MVDKHSIYLLRELSEAGGRDVRGGSMYFHFFCVFVRWSTEWLVVISGACSPGDLW